MGSEGRWATNWSKLLAENGHQVQCICSENVYRNIPSIPNLDITSRITENKYNIALLPGPAIPQGLNADLYLFMHFSPLTILSSDRELYKPDNTIIVYPVDAQFKSSELPKRYENKTYFMPTPIAEKMHPPDYNRPLSIAWTDRWGPSLTSDIYFNSLIRFSRTYNLNTIVFSFQNFYTHVIENEHEDGMRKLNQQLDSLESLEKIPSLPSNELIEKFKTTKFVLNTHGGGLGGSMLEQIIHGAFPLPATNTSYFFSHIDSKLYNNPYPGTMDEIIRNWEIPLKDESFYISALKEYQKEVEPHLYGNCLKQFSKIMLNYGFKL